MPLRDLRSGAVPRTGARGQRREHGGARRTLAGRRARRGDFVFLALGDGVGAGVVIGGRLHRGHHWYAGGIGRMTLDYRDWQSDQGPGGYLGSRINTVEDRGGRR